MTPGIANRLKSRVNSTSRHMTVTWRVCSKVRMIGIGIWAIWLKEGGPFASPQPEGWGLARIGLRTSVDSGCTSVDSDFSEVYGSNRLKLYTKIRYGLSIMHSKWQRGGHLGCKHTWSCNSNNTNWISFKLGAKRMLRMANMYAHLCSVRFQKWRHGGHICFLTPP